MSTLREALANLPGAVFADLHESDDAYLVTIDLPGATAETTEVRVDEGAIRIEARREKDLQTGFEYVREDRSLFLDVELPLPPDATEADAIATVDRGVLELRLSKRSATTGHTIPIE